MAQWLIGLISGLYAGCCKARQLAGFHEMPATLLAFGPLRNQAAQTVPVEVSIVITVEHDTARLRQLLFAFEHLRGVRFEVIVVYEPSSSDPAWLLDTYARRVKIIACPERNRAAARNLGIAMAAGDIVVFIFDDVMPTNAEWLVSIVRAFAANPNMGALSGKVLRGDTQQAEFDGSATSDYGLRVTGQASLDALPKEGYRWVTDVSAAACVFRRNALLDIGGFDTFYADHFHEIDACFRLAHGGYTTQYLDRATNVVQHFQVCLEEHRAEHDQHDWQMVARSTTYHSIKNGADTLPVRALKTIRLTRETPSFREIAYMYRRGDTSRVTWLLMLAAWTRGFVAGFRAGLIQPRQVTSFTHASSVPLLFAQHTQAQRLQIAFVTQAIPGQVGNGGIGRYTFDLARGMYERGHEVHIICKSEQALRHHALGFTIHGISQLAYATQTATSDKPILDKNVTYGLAVRGKLAALYAQGVTFDVIHASNWDSELAAVIRAHVYPTVLMLVSPLAQVIQTEQWTVNDDLRACVTLDRWQIAQADTVCVPSMGVLGSYQKLMHIDASEITHLRLAPLGIVPDLEPVPLHSSKQHKLLFVGRIERRKGVHTLFDVLPRLLEHHPDWECHLVGNDRAPIAGGTTLKEQFLETHWKAAWLKRVVFHGEVDDMQLKRQYTSADLFVAPSLFESFGLIYHEAMQYGVAVVGCTTGGVPEVVEHGVEGLLVAPDTPSELYAALDQLMINHELRERMGTAGLQRVREHTNYRTMSERLEQVYIETMARVGEQRTVQREALWEHALPLFESTPAVQRQGAWQPRDLEAGVPYLYGQAGRNAALCGALRLNMHYYGAAPFVEWHPGSAIVRRSATVS